MNGLARAMRAAVHTAPPAFSWASVPSQLLRINGLEGSIAGSGGVLTGVTDVSGAGQTISLTGSPFYSAADAGLNGAPSFWVDAATRVTASGVSRSNARYVAYVGYKPTTGHAYLWDGSAAGPSAHHVYILSNNTVGSHSASGVLSGASAIGRKRLLAAFDGTTQTLLNGAGSITSGIGLASGSGLIFGSAVDTSLSGMRCAFFMACSAVPSAPIRAAIEAKLIGDFG